MTTDGVVIGGRRRARVEQSIFQTLMIALSVVMLDIFAYGAA
jgi:hypothetical protein